MNEQATITTFYEADHDRLDDPFLPDAREQLVERTGTGVVVVE